MGVVSKLVVYATGQSAGTERPYQCKSCGKRFAERYHECPECGSFRVERKEWQLSE